MKILFTGGGSGGHVFPIIAIIREIKRILPEDVDLIYVGPRDECVSLFLSQEDITIKTILSGKIRRYLTPLSILLNIIDLFRLILGFFQSLFLLLIESPDLIFSKGGHGALPIISAGIVFGVPIFIHESDVSPGIANRIAARCALKVFVSFPKTEYFESKKITVVGNPIRKEIFGGSAEGAKRFLHLTGEKPVIFIMGGSQGAQRVNDLVLLILPELLKDFEIIHQCGSRNLQALKNESKVVIPKEMERFYHPFGLLREQEVREAFFSADMVISRAGAGSIFEIAAFGKPSILIPLPESAQDHQLKNAYSYGESGATMILEEKNLTPQFFLEKIRFLTSHLDELEKMSKSAISFSKPMAAKIVARYLLEYLLS